MLKKRQVILENSQGEEGELANERGRRKKIFERVTKRGEGRRKMIGVGEEEADTPERMMDAGCDNQAFIRF